MPPTDAAPVIRWRALALLVAVFVATLALRVWDVREQFWLLRDQTRDWAIALGSFGDLPLVGPSTHVDGYAVGPAFYWILWTIRVLVGPWFDNLPHAGGIGQSALMSLADCALLVAIWRRTGSAWMALGTTLLVATAAYDLCLAPVIWNPMVASALVKVAMALVLSRWYQGSAWRVLTTAAVAWMAVQAHNGAVFVAVSVCAVLVLEPAFHGDWPAARRAVFAAAAAILLLQVPYVIHQVQHRFGDAAMGAVTDGIGRIFSGEAAPVFGRSVAGYFAAVDFIQFRPWVTPVSIWVLSVTGVALAVRHRRDPVLLAMTLLPQAVAILGFAFFLGGLDHYYYLSLMPAAVLTAVIGGMSLLPRRLVTAASIGLCLAALAVVPARVAFSRTMHRMPEYGPLVQASRILAHRHQPLRAIETSFPLPPTADPEFLYRILGGTFDPAAEWTAVVERDGKVTYRRP